MKITARTRSLISWVLIVRPSVEGREKWGMGSLILRVVELELIKVIIVRLVIWIILIAKLLNC